MHLKFYYASGANCCERVRWLLDYKHIAYELVDLDGDYDQAHFQRISPFGRVPIVEVDGRVLSESMAIAELIEELFPQPALLPTDAFTRALVREACEAVNASIHPVQNSSVVRYFHPDWNKAQMQPVRAQWINSNLAKLQAKLWQESEFVAGTAFSLADIFIVSIYQKGLALGMPDLPRFAQHWAFLQAQPEIYRACPIR